MKINLKVRLKNPVFLAQLGMSILIPIMAYANISLQDLTSWGAVWNMIYGAISNPYVCGMVIVSLWNAINDPTTKGLSDSTEALEYKAPKVCQNGEKDGEC